MSNYKVKLYQKWWFWLIIMILAIFYIIGSAMDAIDNVIASANTFKGNEIIQTSNDTSNLNNNQDVLEPITPPEPEAPTEYKNALKKAQNYSDTMHMSKKGLYEQLTSEYGEQFSEDAAQYAIDNLDVDYKENALKTAKTYQETMSMSKKAIYDQLTSEYGEKFTAEEAQYAIDNLD